MNNIKHFERLLATVLLLAISSASQALTAPDETIRCYHFDTCDGTTRSTGSGNNLGIFHELDTWTLRAVQLQFDKLRGDNRRDIDQVWNFSFDTGVPSGTTLTIAIKDLDLASMELFTGFDAVAGNSLGLASDTTVSTLLAKKFKLTGNGEFSARIRGTTKGGGRGGGAAEGVYDFQVRAAPIPASAVLFLSGLAGMVLVARRRWSADNHSAKAS